MRSLFFLLLAACSTEDGACPAVDAGTAQATIDGEAWTGSGATWAWAGDSLQLNLDRTGDWSMSVVLQTTTGGATLLDAVDAGTFPIEVSLKSGEGGFATVYPAEGASFTTNDADGGALTVAAVDGDALSACFDFAAAGDDGEVTVADAALLATERAD